MGLLAFSWFASMRYSRNDSDSHSKYSLEKVRTNDVKSNFLKGFRSFQMSHCWNSDPTNWISQHHKNQRRNPASATGVWSLQQMGQKSHGPIWFLCFWTASRERTHVGSSTPSKELSAITLDTKKSIKAATYFFFCSLKTDLSFKHLPHLYRSNKYIYIS